MGLGSKAWCCGRRMGFEAHFWLYATDASDPHHLPEVNRSDEVPFAALEDLAAPP